MTGTHAGGMPRLAFLPELVGAFHASSDARRAPPSPAPPRRPRAVPAHAHDACELVLVEAGRVEIGVRGRRLRAAAGALVVLPRGVPHDQTGGEPWLSLCALVRSGSFSETPRVIDLGLGSPAARLMRELPRLVDGGDRAAADAVAHAVLRLVTEAGAPDAPTLPPRLQAAVAHLERDPAAAWDPRTLARAACTSMSHLAALFRRHLGCGARTYLQRVRVARAAELLSRPDVTIKEAAFACGFHDPNHFSRAFARIMGDPPTVWRRGARTPTAHPRMP